MYKIRDPLDDILKYPEYARSKTTFLEIKMHFPI